MSKPIDPADVLENIRRHGARPSNDRNRRDSLANHVVTRKREPEVIYRPDPRQWAPGDK